MRGMKQIKDNDLKSNVSYLSRKKKKEVINVDKDTTIERFITQFYSKDRIYGLSFPLYLNKID